MLLASFSPSYAAGGVNGNVSGTVVDGATGTPITNAQVTLSAPTGSGKATTDSKGTFSILQLPADTYTLSVEVAGGRYQVYSASGVNVVGDQSINLGQIKLNAALTKIASTSTRSNANNVFKPRDTVDVTTISGARITTAVGHQGNTDERALVTSIPGVTLTDGNAITIRGGLVTETGFNFDGIPYNEPFFSGNGSSNRFSGIGNLQVVEGAGDASQGNVAGGAINLNIKRGTYPGFGTFDAEIGAPNAFQQGSLEYGIATRDNHFSNYFSYTQSNEHPYYGNHFLDPTGYNLFYAPDKVTNQDLIDNFVVKFGHNNNQSLQVLYQNRDFRSYGFAGSVFTNGSNPTQPFQNDPRVLNLLGYPAAVGGLANFQSIAPFFAGQTSFSGSPSGEPLGAFNPTQVLKFEYDNSFDANDALALRVYNENIQQGAENYLGSTTIALRPQEEIVGGRRAGFIADLTRQISSKNTLSLNLTGENQHPQWNGYEAASLYNLMTGPSQATDLTNGGVATMNYAGTGSSTSLQDFLQPVNGVCPVKGGCYLSNFFAAGQVPRLPFGGVNYGQTLFQTFGIGLRDQLQFGDNLKADLGVRYEGAIYKYAQNGFNPQAYDVNNPQDVDPAALGNSFTNPRIIEPRAAVSYQLGRNDAVRAAYGRSAIFLNAQTAGTPAGLYNADALKNVPALDSAANPQCGSGTNPRLVTATNPLGLFKCQNYAQQLYWLWDQNNDAPDLGAATLQVASNYDFTYSHQFKGGYAFKVTPFFKNSVGTPSFAIRSIVTDPNTGSIVQEVFTANNNGVNKTTGIELAASSPERREGLSGLFLSATYQNVLDSAPPLISGEASLPIITSGSLVLNDVYRAGYVSPVQLKVGGDLKKGGFRFSPVLSYNIGYPYSLGNTTASALPLQGAFANIPQTNNAFAVNTVVGAFGATGAQLASQYIDPANPGNATRPNIAATRGTPQTSAAGGELSPANLRTDMTLEYKTGRNTFGIFAYNLFGNEYQGSIPLVNPFYQPVSTGVSGPQTGQLKQANPAYASGVYVNRGYANLPRDSYAFSNGAYLLTPGQPTHFTFYYQLGL